MVGEFYSFGILLLLFFRYCLFERCIAKSTRRAMFVRCLVLSMGLIVLNTVCVALLNRPNLVPVWVNLALNTLYFLSCIFCCSFFTFLLFDAMLEHVYDKHCLRRAVVVLIILTSISLLILLLNLFTGILFYFDENGHYQRGPWNSIYYLLLMVELAFLGICYIRNRRSISDQMVSVMRSIPPIVLLLCVLQFSFPNVLLNGTICALVSLVIFLSFHSHTEEHDDLTCAGSRKAFVAELELRSNSNQAVQIVQICLLNLADINLHYSHKHGDALLYEISKYLRHCYPHVRVFRTGGTTFTILLPLGSESEADSRLQEIETRLQSPWTLGEFACRLSCSIAELRSQSLSGSASEIIQHLEYATTLAKKRQAPVRFDQEVDQQFRDRSSMIDLIRKAIETHHFQVYYQPIYCCKKDLFCFAEALLRLSDETGRPIPPDVFIPLAEESGLIRDLTWLVLEDICRLFNSGKYPGLEAVSMNLSMQQFLDPNLPQQIAEILTREGVEPRKLKVEITERFILHDEQYAKAQLDTLESLGIQIYMDDFGTSYSNLYSLLQYPFDIVKLDRSLTATLPENRSAAIIIQTLLQLFRELGKRVIVEGVERAEQAAYLNSIYTDMAQGFYYAKPVPAEELGPYFEH